MVEPDPASQLPSCGAASPRRGQLGPAVAASLAGLAALLWAGAAQADFRLCNNTASRVGVAIGYRDKEGWLTEGWWNVNTHSCETILNGALAARYYYVYAIDYDQGGEWSGRSVLCTREKEFTIRGFQDCLARGYDRTGFFEIDTGEQKSWTVQLSEQAGAGARPQSAAPGEASAPRAPAVAPGATGSQGAGTPEAPASAPGPASADGAVTPPGATSPQGATSPPGATSPEGATSPQGTPNTQAVGTPPSSNVASPAPPSSPPSAAPTSAAPSAGSTPPSPVPPSPVPPSAPAPAGGSRP